MVYASHGYTATPPLTEDTDLGRDRHTLMSLRAVSPDAGLFIDSVPPSNRITGRLALIRCPFPRQCHCISLIFTLWTGSIHS